MMRFGFAWAWLLVVVAAPGIAAEPLAVKAEKQEPPKALADDVRAEFGSDSLAVTRGNETILRIWFRKSIPVKANAEQVKNGLTYREISEGTLLAAVQFPAVFVDFRKQEIPAGVYTLRMAVQPDIGDHKETAPHQDFALLLSAKLDKSSEDLSVKDAIESSRKAIAGDHPGVMLFFPYFGKEAEPKIVAKEKGVSCLQLRRAITADGKDSTLGFSLVIEGSSEKR
jgi:hypothetical protein